MTGSFRSVDYYMRNHLGEPMIRHRALIWPPGVSGLPAWGTYTQPYDSKALDQFPGHKYDAEASLKYFGARYYQPGTSRWISPDGIMPQPYDPQSLNKYAYVRNDPVNLVDPDGQFFVMVTSLLSFFRGPDTTVTVTASLDAADYYWGGWTATSASMYGMLIDAAFKQSAQMGKRAASH